MQKKQITILKEERLIGKKSNQDHKAGPTGPDLSKGPVNAPMILHLQRTVGNNAVQRYLAYSQEQAETHSLQEGLLPLDMAGFAKRGETASSSHNTVQTQVEEVAEEQMDIEIGPIVIDDEYEWEGGPSTEWEGGPPTERIIDPEEGQPDTGIEMTKPPEETRGGSESQGGPAGEKEPEPIIDPEDGKPDTGIRTTTPTEETRGGSEPGGSPTPTEPAVTQPTASQPHRTLYYGARGPDVIELQGKLNSVGMGYIAADGIFGPQTRGMVLQFQERMKLKRDGVVGSRTWEALDAAGGNEPLAEADEARLFDFLREANNLRKVGDYRNALPLYMAAYADPALDDRPMMSRTIIFKIAECHHYLAFADPAKDDPQQHQAELAEAISWYSEFLHLPGVEVGKRDDGSVRIRDCRLDRPPSPLD